MRPSRLAGPLPLAVVAALAAALASCPEPKNYPGTLVAIFSFVGKWDANGIAACLDAGYQELPGADFPFVATFSGDEDGTIRWMTIGDYTRDASFDGRIISSSHSAPRSFALCPDDAGVVDEDFRFAPVSLSQSQALGGVCPPNPLVLGSIPLNPAAGITPPGMLDGGNFDSVRACGDLVDTIRSADPPRCPTCTTLFEVHGVRL